MTRPNGTSRAARPLLVIATVCALLIATAIVALTTYVARVRDGREAALAAIRASGAPVSVEELVAELPRGDPRTMDWALAFEELPDPAWLGRAPEEGQSVEAFLAEAREAGASAQDEALLREWLECLDAEPEAMDLARFWDEDDQTLRRDLPSPADVTPCQIAAIRNAAWLSPQLLEHARLAEHLGPVDARGELERMLAQVPEGELDELFPRSTNGQLGAVRCLSNAAVIASLERRPDEALHLLELAFHAAGLWRGQPRLIEHLKYVVAVGVAGEGLERILADLPEDAGLSRIEAFYEAFDPRAELRQALVGERAIFDRVFQKLRDGEIPLEELGGRAPGRAFGSSLADLVVDVNQAAYLELMELALAECAKPRFDPTRQADARVQERLEATWTSSLVSAFVPKIGNAHAEALYGEVHRDFALAALRAHRDGLAAARAELTARLDPFSGAPYRTRVDPDGTLVLWSVGEDGEDEGGQLESSDDVVWRYRPRR
ncbi:MAG: hypothetical protein H6828_08945 [Planctomycetes bacterium]|nr:hypothetical protein [Planctomycetota bacterium]